MKEENVLIGNLTHGMFLSEKITFFDGKLNTKEPHSMKIIYLKLISVVN